MDAPRARLVPRGLLTASAALGAGTWLAYALDPSAWPGLTGTVVVTAALLANIGVTAHRRTKVAIVRIVQRRVLNPVVRALHTIGLNPLGLVVLETRGRVSGVPRRVPVGNGRDGDVLWVVAEHGLRANWVRNVRVDPTVRVRIRIGLRYRWLDGVAEVLPLDDPIARQRAICRWRPLRLLNAAVVRVLGTDLVTVRIELRPDVARPIDAKADGQVVGLALR